MKTIKEKSEEYVCGFHPSIQRMCKESFGDGANYVLDEIEEFMNNMNFGSNESEMFCKDFKIIIYKFIDQLKK